MAIKLKPKFFGPLELKTESTGAFSYTTNAGYTARTGAPASTELVTPAELIMAALASCIGLSLEMAAQQMNVEPGAIDIEINAAKALDLPNRFGSFDAVVQLEKVTDEKLANKLLKNAKEICTVSNTLNATVSLSLREKAPA
jgi:putative redox protein